MDCCPRNLGLGNALQMGCLLPACFRGACLQPGSWRPGARTFERRHGVREAVSEVRVLTLTVLGLVLAAAGALHSRAAVANKTVVLILIRDHIKAHLPEMNYNPWCIRTRPRAKDSDTKLRKSSAEIPARRRTGNDPSPATWLGYAQLTTAGCRLGRHLLRRGPVRPGEPRKRRPGLTLTPIRFWQRFRDRRPAGG